MMSNITFRVDEELKTAFIKEAKRNNTTATALFQKWMREYLSGKTPDTKENNVNSTNENSANSTNTPESTNDALTALTKRLEDLESTIHQQQDEIGRIGNKVSREDILERLNLLEENQRDHAERLDNAVTPSMLDERLAMATEPIWESLESNQEMETLKECFDGISCLIHSDQRDRPTEDEPQPISNQQDMESEKDDGDLPQEKVLNQADLAKRLNVSAGTIINHKKKEDFPKWSQDCDPENYSWIFVSQEKKFYRK